MAHFAQLNEENLVTQVIVVANQDTADQDGVENEAIGIEFCTNLLGGKWKQTSYNANIRKNYAGVGYKYDAALDAFIPPQPFASWTLNNETAQWEAPTPYPTDDKRYKWDEATTAWVEVPVGE
tara:strand:+ start:812 stop:1180 length:369 start_codon:yes stop_codon:yes gene_type:complete